MTLNLLLSNYFIGKCGACSSASCEVADANCGGSETPCSKEVFLFSRRARF